jgi:N-methylhydantoinase B
MVIGHGVQVPNSTGLFGGLPGACAYHLLKRSNQAVPDLLRRYHSMDSLFADETVEDLGAKPGGFRIGQGDVFAYSFQGGGGYGDPLQRDPARVVKDVREGYLSAQSAAELYGVVLDNGPAEMTIAADRHFHCGCGADLGPADRNWKDHARLRRLPPEACGPHIRLHEELELREFFCPDCASLLEVEVCGKDEDSLWTMALSA